MRSRWVFFVLLYVAVSALATYAQVKPTPTPEKDETIKVDTQLVDVPIAVSSAAGMPLRGLKASNFVVYEDGQKQDVVDFSATSAPFEVALLLDTSGSTRGDLALIQRAAAEFISLLRPGDRVSVISFNTDRTETRAFPVVEVLTGLTDDRKRLNMAVNAVRTSNGTPYYDGLLEIAEKVFRNKPTEEFRGRRAIVALTDGVDSTSSADFELAKEALAPLGVMTFFIKVDTRDFFESNMSGDCQTAMKFSTTQIRRYYRTIAAKPGMERTFDFCKLGEFEKLAISKRLYELAESEMTELAKASGGNVFPIADLNEARAAFKTVADEIGTKYTLAYYPKNEKKDGTYRKIRVDLVGVPKGSVVRAREGYTAPRN